MSRDDEEFALVFNEVYPGLCRLLECLLGGPGAAQEIAAFEQVGNRLRLDRCRRRVVLGAEGALERLCQPEFGEGRQGGGSFEMAALGQMPVLVGSGCPARSRGASHVC